ncbi:hypothetical protein [Maribacter ulvicola]|uniref:Uncharacterized protein n=1 Tax=Maribacter ulvicola TaxID=228959 RepID=A0A1N6YJF9_9FLAO|nr:hypothetical protein [Maribacter ulvicola]SIR14708.1 hypothetical protein SAMN05421797_10717 [Maribacter ulvicola]
MKIIYKLILIGSIVTNTIYSQNSIEENDDSRFSQKEWNNLVNYLNAEITAIAITNQVENNESISSGEKEDYQVFLESLENNEQENPKSFVEITKQLKDNWGVTLKNISQPIDSLKRYEPRIIDSLFAEIENIKSYKTLKIGESKDYADLKSFYIPISKSIDLVKKEIKQEVSQPVVVRESNFQRKKNSSLFKYLIIPALLFFISTIVFFIKWKKQNKKYSDLKIRKENDYKERESDIKNLKIDNNSLRNENANLKNDLKQIKQEKALKKPEERKIIKEETKSPAIELVAEPVIKEPKVLYAGKPTTDGKFIPVSSSPLYGQTIYKLYVKEDGLSADFEIELVDQFITREVTNAPDEYLYRVCNQENSNKEFSREITTTKRGLAVLINDEWLVKEENKATIKFQ